MKLKEIQSNEELVFNGKHVISVYITEDNKIKLKYIRKHDGKKKEFQPPTINDVYAFFLNKGYSNDSAMKFYEYYDSAEWKDGYGKQVKNWKQKAIGVWFKPENKIKETTTKSEMVR